MWHTKMHFSAKCNFGRIAIQWFHIQHYLDHQYTNFQPYTFQVQKMCVFARYATLVPQLQGIIRGNMYWSLYFCIASVIIGSSTCTSSEPLTQIQNNFTELFHIISFIKLHKWFHSAEQKCCQSSR